MKKPVATLLLLVMLLMSVNFVNLTKANFKPYPSPEITIISPITNITYNETTVSLNIKVEMARYDGTLVFEKLAWLNYSLDKQPDVVTTISNELHDYHIYRGIVNCTLSNLTIGKHNLFIHGETTFTKYSVFPDTKFNRTINFIVFIVLGDNSTDSELKVESFPTLSIVVSIIIIAIVTVSLLIYFKKHKERK